MGKISQASCLTAAHMTPGRDRKWMRMAWQGGEKEARSKTVPKKQALPSAGRWARRPRGSQGQSIGECKLDCNPDFTHYATLGPFIDFVVIQYPPRQDCYVENKFMGTQIKVTSCVTSQ